MLNGTRPPATQDVILGGSSILAVTDALSEAELQTLQELGWRVTVYDVNGSFIVPGFLDLHVHLTGGGTAARHRLAILLRKGRRVNRVRVWAWPP